MYTIKEVAEMFRVTEKTVKNWIASGDMVAIRIAGTVRIADEVIERLKSGGK